MAQDCKYDGSGDGGSYEDPLIIECCCGQCDTDRTCAADSTTGSGVWQEKHSLLCPIEGCGSGGKGRVQKKMREKYGLLPTLPRTPPTPGFDLFSKIKIDPHFFVENII